MKLKGAAKSWYCKYLKMVQTIVPIAISNIYQKKAER
jgi:hypothetical protein